MKVVGRNAVVRAYKSIFVLRRDYHAVSSRRSGKQITVLSALRPTLRVTLQRANVHAVCLTSKEMNIVKTKHLIVVARRDDNLLN